MTNKVHGPRILDSPEPFKPLNPWGRPMPKATRIKSREPTPLYQVAVPDRDGALQPIGPKMILSVAERCCEALALAQLRGKDTSWGIPQVIKVSP